MDKFKFYILKIHLDHTQIRSFLTANNDDFYGIRFINQDNKFLKFHFYERKILETTYIDKDFKEHTIEQMKTDDFSFYIYIDDNICFLILENPSRNISFFKNFLSQKLNNKVTISNIEINPLKLFSFLELNKDVDFIVSSLEVKDLQLSKTSIATLTIKSTENLVDKFENYLHTDKYHISKALFQSTLKFKGKLILANDCSLSLQIHQQNEFFEMFLDFLYKHFLSITH